MASSPNEDSKAGTDSKASFPGASASLEEVLTTAELHRRPSRHPDYKAENEALVALAKHMSEAPETILQKLVETARELCRAGSAGVSIEETFQGEEIFRWQAISGRLEKFLGGTMPRHFSPCGTTVDIGCPQVMTDAVRYYPYIAGLQIPVREVLLVPFYRGDRAVGTIWIVSHDATGVFDAEDARLIGSLSQFAAAALDSLRAAQKRAATQLELEEMHFKLETALRAGSIATWSWDVEKDRVQVDEHGARLFGVSHADAQGGPVAAYIAAIHPEDRDRVTAEIQNVLDNGDSYEIEYRIGHGKKVFWVIARGRVLRDSQGKLVQFPGVLVDITDRKLAQIDLERRQKEASDALRAAHDQALASSQAKDDFLAALSHELRTPLNPALLLASEASKNTDYPRGARADFEAVRKNIELEARLIDDLLDITRISSGKFVLYRALKDLHNILRDAADKVDPDIQEKKITLSWDLGARDSFIYGDPVRLQQVFWNVLKNAVKFTPVGGRIHVESHNATGGRHVSFQIHDSGIGMEAEEVGRIFEAFAQGRHAEGQGAHLFGGLGLGLAISKKIVEAHNGHISATSLGKGHGSTFVIELPNTTLSEAQEDTHINSLVSLASPWPNPPAPPAASLRILLVEDHADTRRVLQRLLIRRSHEVSVAGSGEETLALLPAQDFDLVICDIGLPDTDGYALLREIHQLRPGLPAIAMTGYGMESDQENSAAAGFLAHLTKPVSLAALEDTLSGLSLARYTP